MAANSKVQVDSGGDNPRFSVLGQSRLLRSRLPKEVDKQPEDSGVSQTVSVRKNNTDLWLEL